MVNLRPLTFPPSTNLSQWNFSILSKTSPHHSIPPHSSPPPSLSPSFPLLRFFISPKSSIPPGFLLPFVLFTHSSQHSINPLLHSIRPSLLRVKIVTLSDFCIWACFRRSRRLVRLFYFCFLNTLYICWCIIFFKVQFNWLVKALIFGEFDFVMDIVFVVEFFVFF